MILARYKHPSIAGLSAVETLVGAAIFAIVAISMYGGYTRLLEGVTSSRVKVVAAALANEQFEIIRNVPYSDIGIDGGIPDGILEATQTLTRDSIEFSLTTTVRNIDDPFDGTIGGSPNDLSPADYKLVAIEISCTECKDFEPTTFTAQVGPKNLETASTNGALFIRVFDANGVPISGASVHVENNQESPAIVIDDTTSNDGWLQIVDAPPGVEAYEITVTKSGFSTDQTYTTGDAGNPNPVKPHATVALQQVTQISFAIDALSDIDVSSKTDTCTTVDDIDFTLQGSKLIGNSPDVYKYEVDHVTDASGLLAINDLEWDTYAATLIDTAYDLAGIIPLSPFALAPNSTQDVQLIVAPKDPLALLVAVKDGSTQLPLSDANVTLTSGSSTSLTTGQGFLRQTDWSGGSGQSSFIDETRYFDSDGNVMIDNPAGEVLLKQEFTTYEPSGYLVSSTFDTGSTSNFHQIVWDPDDQPTETGVDSVRMQIATNNDQTTWNYIGPDGTSSSYYTLSDTNLHDSHDGDQYLRYQLFLQTEDTDYSPNVSDVAFTFTSDCTPPGQTLFTGLASNTYTIAVEKSGYQTYNDTVSITDNWQQHEVTLYPE